VAQPGVKPMPKRVGHRPTDGGGRSRKLLKKLKIKKKNQSPSSSSSLLAGMA